jgi:hypothetical protein
LLAKNKGYINIEFQAQPRQTREKRKYVCVLFKNDSKETKSQDPGSSLRRKKPEILLETWNKNWPKDRTHRQSRVRP